MHFRHALKNTLLPVITVIGIQVGGLIAFSIITETVFQWPGMGQLFIQSVQFADIPVMAAYLVMVSFIFVAINFFVDLLYAAIDPRLRLDRAQLGTAGGLSDEASHVRAALPLGLIGAACLGSFAATSSGTTRAPFLLDMARDLDVSMPLVANLVSLTSTAWGVTSATGRLAVRRGRPPAGCWWRSLFGAGARHAGAGAGRLVLLGRRLGRPSAAAAAAPSPGVVFAEVSGRVPDGQRGRALGWVMSGQSLTLLIGVPMAAAVGLADRLARLAALRRRPCRCSPASALFATVGRGTAGHMRGTRAALDQARRCRRGCWACSAPASPSASATAWPRSTFADLPAGDLSPVAGRDSRSRWRCSPSGNVAGTIAGRPARRPAARPADDLRHRHGAVRRCAAVALFLWHPSLAISVALGFVYVLLNALGRPSYMAALRRRARRRARHGAGAERRLAPASAGSAPRRWARR